jgi:bifunctional NMN adenylyltransferase/nudix hydrolase
MSQNKQYDFTVLLGRFQPFHSGHQQIIQKALDISERIIVLTGSSHRPPELRNPWSHEDRKQMILGSFSEDVRKKIIIMPLIDSPYNDDQWIFNIQTIVKGVTQSYIVRPHIKLKIALIGHDKDESTYYLKKFPQWDFVDIGEVSDNVNATDVRNVYFSNSIYYTKPELLNFRLPEGTISFLKNVYDEQTYLKIYSENAFTQEYKKPYENLKYAPTFNTADACVVCCGHVLLVKRAAQPGMGLLALPGGYVEPNERVVDAMIRELKEETKIKVPSAVLRGSIKKQELFDYPYRSSRGRIFTYGYLIELPDDELPKTKASSDASDIVWIPIADINPEDMFEDHYAIIMTLLGI